jgi:hypothetical protein
MDETSSSEPTDHLSAYLAGELEAMRTAWVELLDRSPPCPTWTWTQLAEGLLDLTKTPVDELVIRGALSGLVKQARFKPPELILEEVVRLIRAAQDQLFADKARVVLEGEMT